MNASFAGTLVGLVAALVAMPVPRVPAAEGDDDTRIEHLVIDDSYFVKVERNGVQQTFSGDFAKLTEHWIVLHRLSEQRNEIGVPVVSRIPYVNRLFKNVGIGQTDDFIWIPREAATIRGRLRTGKSEQLCPATDEPSVGEDCHVLFADRDHQQIETEGKLESIADDKLTLTVRETVSTEVRKSGLSKLPLVGGYFTETRTEVHETHPQFARSDILCVRTAKARELSAGERIGVNQ